MSLPYGESDIQLAGTHFLGAGTVVSCCVLCHRVRHCCHCALSLVQYSFYRYAYYSTVCKEPSGYFTCHAVFCRKWCVLHKETFRHSYIRVKNKKRSAH